jgi:hypothetical protein
MVSHIYCVFAKFYQLTLQKLLEGDNLEPEIRADEAPARKKKKIEYSEVLTKKRELQNELLGIEIYKSKLQVLKLERELKLWPSEFTKDIKSSVHMVLIEADNEDNDFGVNI